MKINRNNRVDWLDGFAQQIVEAGDKLPKDTAVTEGKKRQASILDDIRSIVSKAPVYSSVQDKVNDLQERVGLKAYLEKSSIIKEINQAKQASFSPELRDRIDQFVANKISAHHGYIHLPALQQAIVETFQRDGVGTEMVEEPEFERYLFDKIEAEKKLHPIKMDVGSLGKGLADSSDQHHSDDFFAGLNPAK